MRLTPGPARDLDLDTVDLFDLFDLDLCGTGDPHPVWDVMRAKAPLHHQVLPDGSEFWSVTRYEDVCRVLGDHREFTSERGTVPTHLGQDDVAAGVLLTSTDPPRHTEVRRPLGSKLTARAVKSWEDSIRRSVTRFLEPALDGEVFDLAEKALLLPAIVTGPLLGIPEKDWEELVPLTAMVAAPSDPHFQLCSEAATLAISHHELVGYVTEWVKNRRDSGLDDDSLLHHLMNVRPGGTPLSDQEIALDGYSILLGANVTIPHTVSGTVQALIEQPEQFSKAQADPTLIPNLVEEGLRWTSAACNFMRYASTDAPVAGGVIPAGSAVVAWIGSANRDTAQFAAPHTFDITRPNAKRQVAFGFGPHFCIGAPPDPARLLRGTSIPVRLPPTGRRTGAPALLLHRRHDPPARHRSETAHPMTPGPALATPWFVRPPPPRTRPRPPVLLPLLRLRLRRLRVQRLARHRRRRRDLPGAVPRPREPPRPPPLRQLREPRRVTRRSPHPAARHTVRVLRALRGRPARLRERAAPGHRRPAHPPQPHPAVDHCEKIRHMPALSPLFARVLKVQAERLRQHLRRPEEVERDQQTCLLRRLEAMSPAGRHHVLQARVMPPNTAPGESSESAGTTAPAHAPGHVPAS